MFDIVYSIHELVHAQLRPSTGMLRDSEEDEHRHTLEDPEVHESKWMLRQDTLTANSDGGRQIRSLQSFLQKEQSLTLSVEEPLPSESELQGSSVAYFDNESDVATIFTPPGDKNHLIKKYTAQIQNLEMDNVTLMEELDTVNRKLQVAESLQSTVQAELASAKEEAKNLRIEARELKENVSTFILLS